MRHSVKSLKSSTAISTLALAGAVFVGASSAQAATVSNISPITARSNAFNGSCILDFSYVATSERVDTTNLLGPVDFVSHQLIADGTTAPNGSIVTAVSANPIGSTQTITNGFGAGQTVQSRNWVMRFYDPTSANNGAVNPLVDVSVPISTLLAGGPACSALVSNGAPVADAGADQNVAGNSAVNLSGQASDADNDPLTIQWTQTAGPTVALTGANTTSPSFTAPTKTGAAQVLTFEISASDGIATTTDTVDITVAANVDPSADAGPDQTAAGGSTVTLDGSGSSDPDGDPLAFSWVQNFGPTVSLSGANTANPSFIAPPRTSTAQVLIFELTLSDGLTTSDDAVRITIPPNIGPTADAGPDQTVSGGSSVTLDASASSDADGDPITYTWTQVSGPTVALSGANAVSPTFTAPPRGANAQSLVFEVTVSDGTASASDTVEIEVPANRAPVAQVSAPTVVSGGDSVTLDGSASSDPDGDTLVYQWSQTSGPQVVLSSASAVSPTFTAPPSTGGTQTLIFQLLVADPFDASNAAVASVDIAINVAPTPDAGPDQTVTGNSTVTLDGTGSSDPENDPLSYTWVQTSGPTVTLSSATIAQPTFNAPQAVATQQTLTFQLSVDDGINRNFNVGRQPRSTNNTVDTVDIIISANQPPVANAGVDQGPIDSGTTVTLDGSGSSDPDGDPLTYTWTQVSGPTVSLTGATSAAPTFIAPLVNGTEDLVFQLVVSDGQESSVADTVTISVRAIGSVTIIKEVVGSDRSFAFTSDIADLNASLFTNAGRGELRATNVAAGTYTITAGDLRGDGYAITSITCNDSDSTPDVSSRSVALDLSPGEDLVCTFSAVDSRAAAEGAISNFLTGRNALILAHQPDLQRRLDRLRGTSPAPGSVSAFGIPIPGSNILPLTARITKGQAQLSASLGQALSSLGGDRTNGSGKLDVWTEAYLSRARIGDQNGNFRVVYFGADLLISEDLLLGALTGFDDFDDTGRLEQGEAQGNGWLVGPYLTARLAPTLFAEARAAWGSSDNQVSPLGTFTDAFETSRSYYSGSLVGQFELGGQTQIQPEVTIRHLSERVKSYTDGLSVDIPSQTVSQGDISFKPRISHLIEASDTWSLRPWAETEGIYTFGASEGVILPNSSSIRNGVGSLGQFRMRVEAGVDAFSQFGLRATLSGFHDGIGSDGLRSTGVQVGISFSF